MLSSTLIEPLQRAASQKAPTLNSSPSGNQTTDSAANEIGRPSQAVPAKNAATATRVPPLQRNIPEAESLESVKARIRLASNAMQSPTSAQSAAQNAANAQRAAAATHSAPKPNLNDIELARQRALLKLQAVVLAQDTFEAGCLAFCNDLARQIKAHRVSVGTFRNGHSSIVVTNNGDARKLDQSVAKLLGSAVDEALDQASLITSPELEDGILINQAAEAVQRLHLSPTIVVPLLTSDRPEGGVIVELAKQTQLNALVVGFVQDAVALVGPVLSLMHRDELGLFERTRLKWRRKSQRLMGDDARWVRWSFFGVLASLLLLSFMPISHTINSPARIEGAVIRNVTAPAQGFIKKVFVRPGDAVTQDQPLAELADRELQLERNKLLSEAAMHDSSYMTAMARNDRAAMMQAQSKQGEARAQLELIDQQLTRGMLVAPMDGVVLDGDLTQQIGSPVERGQNLMMVAPKNRFRTIIELDERDIRWVKVGQISTLSLSALPWDDVEIKVERINPMAVVRDGHNVFEIEASIAKADQQDVISQLRPGLRGVAKVNVGEDSIMNTYARRTAEAVQRAWWRWAP
jgi:multidrug efflux pump subunit AcrA (membrane-fusion protein)